MLDIATDPTTSLLQTHPDTSSSLKALALALEQRDQYTDEHCDRVCRLANERKQEKVIEMKKR